MGRRFLLSACFACALSGPVLAYSATTYEERKEIIAKVVDPCYMHSIESSPKLQNMSKSKALDLLKRMDPKGINLLVNTIAPMLYGITVKEKESLYDFALSECIKGSGSILR